MAYSAQLIDLRNDSGIQTVSGCCHSSQLFADQVNTATRRLMRRGGWWNTEALLKVCFVGCRIVWPRIVGTVLGVRFCRGDGIPIYNNHWAVAGYMPGGCCGFDTFRGNAVMRDDNTVPCYREITGNTGHYIKYHIVKQNDVGKTIKIFGFKYGNQPLQEKDANGVWQMGLTLTATPAGVQTTELVTKITNVVRQATEGRAWLYQVDQTTGDMIDLAMYEPQETNPVWRSSIIQNIRAIPGYTDEYDRCVRQAEALVKLQFVPAVSDNDFVMLDNRDALELGIAGLRAERAGDDVTAQTKFALAIKELNMEIRDRNPAMQTVIRTNDLSSACVFSNPI